MYGIFTLLAMNIAWAGIAWGQSYQSTININRTGSLSFSSIPTSFDFGVTGSMAIRKAAFTDPTVTDGTLPPSKKLTIQDTRGSGGFMVNVSVQNDFSNGLGQTIPVSSTPPNDNFRIVTSGTITGLTGTVAAGMTYETGFVDPATETVTALVNTNATDFHLESTFTAVANNILDKTVPVDVFDGSLGAAESRIGRMSAGVSGMLYVPPLQKPGTYSTIMTWTLIDSTTP